MSAVSQWRNEERKFKKSSTTLLPEAMVRQHIHPMLAEDPPEALPQLLLAEWTSLVEARNTTTKQIIDEVGVL